MNRGTAVLLAFGCLAGLFVQGLAGAPAPAVPASPSEYVAVERFLADIEKPPVAYQARRRLEASSAKLNESAWMEAVTQYDPARGFTYSIVAQGGSERICRRVLKAVLEAEQENSTREEWHKGNLSHANYEFGFGGHAGNGMLKMQLTPRRRDSRLVLGSALLTAKSGNLVRVEGRLSKSPSFWVRSVTIMRRYTRVGGVSLPTVIESLADVKMFGKSSFSMRYTYTAVNGRNVGHTASTTTSFGPSQQLLALHAQLTEGP
jgi:hypothetical protein